MASRSGHAAVGGREAPITRDRAREFARALGLLEWKALLYDADAVLFRCGSEQ